MKTTIKLLMLMFAIIFYSACEQEEQVEPEVSKELLTDIKMPVPKLERTTYIVFVGGPNQKTLEILPILKAHNATVTFFCTYDSLSTYPDIATRIISEGHQISNMGMDIVDWLSIDESQNYKIPDNLNTTQNLIDVVDPNDTSMFFKPTHNNLRKDQADVIKNYGYVIISTKFSVEDEIVTADLAATTAIHSVESSQLQITEFLIGGNHTMFALESVLNYTSDSIYVKPLRNLTDLSKLPTDIWDFEITTGFKK